MKVVLVTGASSGIGKAIALHLHAHGYRVFGTSRNPEKTQLPFEMLALEIRDEQSIAACVQSILSKTGRLDVLVNNAGAGITGPLEEVPMNQVQKQFETNLFGPLALCREVLPQMRAQQTGVIVNITSIAGYMGLPFRGWYSASKGALELCTEALSMEVKSFGIKVLSVAPGDFATQIAAGRYHAPVTGSAYPAYAPSLELMNAHVDGAGNPEIMARAVRRIIESKNPKLHYRVGAFLQKFSIVLKKCLPDRTYEKLLCKHYKL